MLSSVILRSILVQKPYQYFHYYFLLEKQLGSTLADLEFETDLGVSLRKFRNHEWTVYEVCHYSFLSLVIFFVFIIFPVTLWIKIPVLVAFGVCFMMPLTSQFFLHALPIFAWLALFFSAGKIPTSWKPAISVKSLPAMETVLYGDNLSNVLATFATSTLDMLAWIPYGILHFSAPFVVAIFIFIFGPPTSLRSFGFAFGYMNLLGLLVQFSFPAAPPWYKNLHGLEPANYSMSGSPGGLGRIDEILGFDMYTSAFSNSPVVFGAFPSLHSGCAVMEALFLSWLFPKLKVVWWSYAAWLWWSTMYLTHHYFIDLICGAVFSVVVFTYTKYRHLPVIVPDKFCRWSYTEIEKIDIAQCDPLAYHNDASSLAPPDYENGFFLNQVGSRLHSPYPINENNSIYEMTSFSRSKQSLRISIPNQQTRGRSTSSVNLPTTSATNATSGTSGSSATSATNSTTTSTGAAGASGTSGATTTTTVVPTEELDTSLLENSSSPSVFEGENDDRNNLISSAASSTSLDDIDSVSNLGGGSSSHYKNQTNTVTNR